MIFEHDLGLDPPISRAEQRALDTIIESIVKSLHRRLPPSLELVGVRLDVTRPSLCDFDHLVSPSGERPEEFH